MPGPTTFVDRITSRFGDTIGLNTTQPRRRSAGFDIEEFRSSIGVYGVAPTNLFLVTINPRGSKAAQEAGRIGLSPQSMSFFCMKADLPGVNLAVDGNVPTGIGPLELFPYTAIFNDMNLDFIGDSGGRILTFFQNWINRIVAYDNTKNYSGFYKVSYKQDYIAQINILVFNNQSDKVIEYTIDECFPHVIQNIPMNWADQNNFMNIGVGFYFKTWSTNRITPNYNLDTNPGLTTLQKLLKLGTVAQTVMAIRKPQNIADSINVLNNANVIGGGLTNFF